MIVLLSLAKLVKSKYCN